MLIPAKTTITSSDWCNGARKDRKENVGWSGGGAAEGFSISYDRVMNLRSSISNQEPGVQGVPSQRSGLSCWFKTECVHSSYYWQSRPNPSSATAESSFHGTTISVFQHADYHLSFPVSSDIDVDWCHWLHVSLLLTKLFSIPELQRLEWRSQKKISNCNALVYCDWAWNATLFICI